MQDVIRIDILIEVLCEQKTYYDLWMINDIISDFTASVQLLSIGFVLLLCYQKVDSDLLMYDGNQSDIYQCVNFARRYGLDIKDILRRIVVSRAFTVYQLVALITKELPKVVRRFDTKVLIIRDMLHMFTDPFWCILIDVLF